MADNISIIEKAFARLRENKDTIIDAGMPAMMDDAMEFALKIHDAAHQNHVKNNESYGWSVIHDGTIVEGVARGTSFQAKDIVLDQLEMASMGYKKGWNGILMASMTGAYDELYEIDVLNDTKNYTETHFKEYFKPVK